MIYKNEDEGLQSSTLVDLDLKNSPPKNTSILIKDYILNENDIEYLRQYSQNISKIVIKYTDPATADSAYKIITECLSILGKLESLEIDTSCLREEIGASQEHFVQEAFYSIVKYISHNNRLEEFSLSFKDNPTQISSLEKALRHNMSITEGQIYIANNNNMTYLYRTFKKRNEDIHKKFIDAVLENNLSLFKEGHEKYYPLYQKLNKKHLAKLLEQYTTTDKISELFSAFDSHIEEKFLHLAGITNKTKHLPISDSVNGDDILPEELVNIIVKHLDYITGGQSLFAIEPCSENALTGNQIEHTDLV